MLFVLLLLGTFFSAAEMAFSSLNLARIKTLEDIEGKKGAELSLSLAYMKITSTM